MTSQPDEWDSIDVKATGARHDGEKFPTRRSVAAKVGVFGIGLHAYWSQFPGLQGRLTGHQQSIESRLESLGVEVKSAGMVDTSQAGRAAGELFAREQVDLVFCYSATYATSAQVLPIAQQVKRPVVILNLQPTAALDYESTDTGEWLANCTVCPVPEISNAFARSGIPFHVVSGELNGDEAWRQIGDWCAAATASAALRKSRIGFLGHTYPGMLDMYSDFTAVQAQTGAHIEILEMCDLQKMVEAISDTEVAGERERAAETFQLESLVDERDLDWATRVSAGLSRLVREYQLDGLTYYYRGLDNNTYEQLAAGLILGNSFLTSAGIPASGEGDLKTCLAMLLMDRLNAGGSYTEFYAMDFRDQFVLMGHDGPGHLAISNEKPILRSLGLYHGKRGYGVSVEFKVRTGPITILGVTQTRTGQLKLLAAEGESLPGPILKIGNTNSRLRFRLGPAEFVNTWCAEGPTHHCALGVGHQVGRLQKVASLTGIPIVEIAGKTQA